MSRLSPGNYALGYLDGETFLVFYVGRSDSDVRSRLHEWVGAPSRPRPGASSSQTPWDAHPRRGYPAAAPTSAHGGAGANSGYTRFAYSYAASAEAAFEKECRNYEDFGRRQPRQRHPARSDGGLTAMWKRLDPRGSRLWKWLRRAHDERRAARTRARFWAELRAGEREAEAQLRP